jgi:Rrf2 family iron-sulfur cluster assembly transcriptional regulator
MAMADLATRETTGRPNDVSCLADIAARQQLSQSYLEQLFGKLRRAGLVRSARGPGGGYRLARPSSEIAIAEIVGAVDEPLSATRCETGGGGCMVRSDAAVCSDKCQTHDLWAELGRQIGLFLAGVSLADVVLDRVVGRATAPRVLKTVRHGAGGEPG